LMKAVKKHTDTKWILLYIERWLKAPMQLQDGTTKVRHSGTPQGGVISPVLSNLFLHYVFDMWMKRNHRHKPWCRYADDGLVHCETEEQAQQLLRELTLRFKECGLELHPDKTKIIYCKDDNRKKDYPNKSFDFLGYTFRARSCRNRKHEILFMNFTPAVSKTAMKSMRAKVRKDNVRRRTDLSLSEIAKWYNPILNGWLNYYGRYTIAELEAVMRHFDQALVSWAMAKYLKLTNRKIRAWKFLERIKERQPRLFAHWARRNEQGLLA